MSATSFRSVGHLAFGSGSQHHFNRFENEYFEEIPQNCDACQTEVAVENDKNLAGLQTGKAGKGESDGIAKKPNKRVMFAESHSVSETSDRVGLITADKSIRSDSMISDSMLEKSCSVEDLRFTKNRSNRSKSHWNPLLRSFKRKSLMKVRMNGSCDQLIVS